MAVLFYHLFYILGRETFGLSFTRATKWSQSMSPTKTQRKLLQTVGFTRTILTESAWMRRFFCIDGRKL